MSDLFEQDQQPMPAKAASPPQPRSDDARLFPLPLVPFEQYMLADDRRRYAMTFPMRVELDNVPDREAFDAAYRDALARHPLLTCRVVRKWFKRYWVFFERDPPALQWTEDAEPELPPGRYLDIRRQSPVEGYVFVGEGRTILGLLFHHAVCDGIGAMQFIGDILAGYGRRVAGEHQLPKSLPIAAETLKHRGQFDVQTPFEVSAWDAFRGTLGEVWKVLTRRPRPLAGDKRSRRESGDGHASMLIDQIEADVYGRFRLRAQQLNVSANDLMLRDMFLTVSEWNRAHAGKGGGWLRINMPTSLRGKRDALMPAANVLGYALLTRHDRECGDRERLLASVASDTKAIHTWSLGAMFVESLRITARVPFGMVLATRLMQRSATVVLSNLGDPSRRFRARFPRVEGTLRAGNLRLRSIVATPPIRPGTRMALAVTNYGGRLAIGLHADPRFFSAEDSQAFLRRYVRQLEQTADELVPADGGPATDCG